ncbi:hypothetical protein [Nocardioides sp.]|uniref:hypothetical protein n=1 Tax=Nocardioides sp. TaxID=35761 RepID=UPI0027363921|nr:hypothetical protein [Nocardioides sp.]MDP3893746.1 hypothetical protein [Nocardioides sp.]
MSLTQSADAFASAHEDALNDVVTAICSARPHLLSYGSPAFVPASSVHETQMSPIPFPGTSGVQWHVSFTIPKVDLFDQDQPLPPELSLGPGGFSVTTDVTLCVDCDPRGREPDRDPDREHPDKRHHDPEHHDREHPDEREPGKAEHATCVRLHLAAVGRPVPTVTAGEPALTFTVDALEIVDITPVELENVLECLLTVILRSVLSTIRIPLTALRAGAFALTPTEGPLVETDLILVRGDF